MLAPVGVREAFQSGFYDQEAALCALLCTYDATYVYHRLMVVRVGIRELRDRLSGYLERARAGEQIEITDRGRPIAMLVPLPESRATLAELIAGGKLRLAERTWRPGASRVRVPAGARPPSEHLQDMRAERM